MPFLTPVCPSSLLCSAYTGTCCALRRRVPTACWREWKIPSVNSPRYWVTLMIYGCCHTQLCKILWWGTQFRCWYSLCSECTVELQSHTEQWWFIHMHTFFLLSMWDNVVILLIFSLANIMLQDAKPAIMHFSKKKKKKASPHSFSVDTCCQCEPAGICKGNRWPPQFWCSLLHATWALRAVSTGP